MKNGMKGFPLDVKLAYGPPPVDKEAAMKRMVRDVKKLLKKEGKRINDVLDKKVDRSNYDHTKWLGDGNTAYSVGGRSTDVSQLVSSLACRIKEVFPVNGVPFDIVNRLTLLQVALELAEEDIQDLIYAVGARLEKEDE